MGSVFFFIIYYISLVKYLVQNVSKFVIAFKQVYVTSHQLLYLP